MCGVYTVSIFWVVVYHRGFTCNICRLATATLLMDVGAVSSGEI